MSKNAVLLLSSVMTAMTGRVTDFRIGAVTTVDVKIGYVLLETRIMTAT